MIQSEVSMSLLGNGGQGIFINCLTAPAKPAEPQVFANLVLVQPETKPGNTGGQEPHSCFIAARTLFQLPSIEGLREPCFLEYDFVFCRNKCATAC